MYNNRRSITSGLSGAIVLLGLILAFASGGSNGFNLVVFFIALAFAVLAGSLGTLNAKGVYGGLIGAMWMLMLALFFATGSWLWFLVGALLSTVLGTLIKPIMGAIMGIGIHGSYTSLVYTNLLSKYNLKDDDVLSIYTSDPLPMGPVVVHSDILESDVRRLQSAFLLLDDPTLLRSLGISGFGSVTDSVYDPVRNVAHELGIDLAHV